MGRQSSFVAPPVEEVVEVPQPPRVWSAQQAEIFHWFEVPFLYSEPPNPGHLVVRARAGTGKTTTIIEGVQRAPELRILVAAFNKKIAVELSTRIQSDKVEAMTLHSLGYKAIQRQWPGMRSIDRPKVKRSDWLTQQVAGAMLPKPIQRLISELHTKVREMVPLKPTMADVMSIALQFNLLPDQGWGQYNDTFVVNAAMSAVRYAASEEPRYDIGIDFADMIFLPLAWDLLTPDYDLVVIDEAQDMTGAQLLMAQRVCAGRICVVGDDKQAIYGFRGADSGSLDRLKKELAAAELPLHTTYRCGKSIVVHANRLVADIVAGPDNHEGLLDYLNEDQQVLEQVGPGDFVLSRLNAPLVGLTLKLLAQGKRARMSGRDIGKQITSVLWSLKAEYCRSLPELATKVKAWRSKMVTKAANFGDLEAVDRIHDQADVIESLIMASSGPKDLLAKVAFLFQDTDDMEKDTIVLSSVHKAKGLEANRVFVLQDTFYRRGRSQEEMNIEYVAVTRAKHHLTLVGELRAV